MKHPIRFRISALLLALTMALSLCACGVNPQTLRDALAQTQAGSSRNESPEPSPPETSGEKTPDTEAASTSRPAASPGPGPGSEEARQSLQLLRDRLDCLRVFVYAPKEDRIRRILNEYHEQVDDPESYLAKRDKQRASYYNSFADIRWGDRRNYHLMVNSSLGLENAVQLIAVAAQGGAVNE